MHRETSPLAVYWERWDGSLEPETVFAPLDAYFATWSSEASTG
ncbi:MAG: hypothetical protein P8Y44_12560 [Acidobacteriota bacterium]